MWDERLTAFLESGCSIIVGIVGDDGEPHARRGWGIDVVDPRTGRIRLLLDAHGGGPRGPGLEGWSGAPRIAITGADIHTLYSVQGKGVVVSAGAPTDDDRARHEAFCGAMFDHIHDVDGFPVEMMARIRPNELVALEVDIDELFDQTPGPQAGTPIAPSSAD